MRGLGEVADDQQHEADGNDDGENSFSLGMGFAAAACPGCGLVTGAGPCPDCGTEVPAPEELNEATQARRDVLLPIREAAEELLAGFDALPRGTIPITATAMLSGFVEAELFFRALEVSGLGRELEQFDLDDPEAIRGPVRELFEARLQTVTRTLEACRELAGFAPQTPGDELQEIAYELGRKAARLLIAFLAALSAIDLQAAYDAQQEIQAELDDYARLDGLSMLLDRLAEAPSGVDARVGHALARPGVYTDAFETVDLGRVFGAFSESGNAYLAVGRRAAQYFSFILDAELSAEQEAAAVLLAIPLVGVVAAERPLIAHRLASMTYDLFHEAAEINREGVADLVDATATEGAQVFAALAQLRAAFAAIEHSAESDTKAADELASSALEAFSNLVEVTWRLQARTLQKLNDVRSGRSAATTEVELSVEDIHERLAASRAPALREFAAGLDSGVLAAAPPKGDAAEEESAYERLEEASQRLLAAMAGVDAGYCLGIVGETLEVRTPAWMERGGAVYATELLARTLFGAAGAELREITADGSRAVVAPLRADAELDPTRLLTAIAGLRAIVTETEWFSITDVDGTVLVEVSADTLRAAQDEPEPMRDLALVACFYDGLVARGETPEAAVLTLAATQLVATILPAIQAIGDAPWDAAEYRRLAARINYVNDFLRGKRVPTKPVRRLGERLARASASASMASHGDLPAATRLLQQLSRLGNWAMSHSRWPPI
jgi:hypothetical protein